MSSLICIIADMKYLYVRCSRVLASGQHGCYINISTQVLQVVTIHDLATQAEKNRETER